MEQKLLKHFTEKSKTIEQRIAAGKKKRIRFPRIKQGEYAPAAKRANPISILEAQAQTRIKELVPVRYARMLTSPFAFLRGAAAIMAADLAAGPATSGITVQACGDMHLANFGVFASVERNLIFGINDFDETLPGPWEWDLKRLAASIVASGRFLGADEESCKEAVMAAVRSYRRRMKDFAEMGHLELWYTSITEKKVLKTLTPEMQKAFEKITGKARTRTHMQVLAKLTDIVDEKYRLRDEAPLIMHPARTRSGNTIEQATELFLQSYLPSLADDRRTLLEHYRIVDVARKVVGVGSVGTACWVIFLTGNHNEDPLFLQIKEAQPSVLEPFIGKTIYNNNGQRVVAGQRLLQAAPDIFLGWGKLEGRDFYVRQLRDFKGGAEFDPASANVKGLAPYSALCAWALALSHAKSGDAAMIAGYVGNSDELDEAMSKFAFAYADQTIKDHKALAAAAKSKKIKVAGAKS